ncbi:hypothetical protein WCX49_00825 [Sulfurimonas sp. HSL-1656]|uniref:hypothetical protein n=1 Tax=Thiomicrolovo subterrani TaxID=3131934 RepID=UPI0031FA0CBF
MRAPRGFGKRYFTLSAIQAYSAVTTLEHRENRTLAHHGMVSDESDDEACLEEDEAALEPATTELPGGRHRPCHCNLHFHRLACRHLRSHNRPRRARNPFRYTRSTLSPPAVPYPLTPLSISKGTL